MQYPTGITSRCLVPYNKGKKTCREDLVIFCLFFHENAKMQHFFCTNLQILNPLPGLRPHRVHFVRRRAVRQFRAGQLLVSDLAIT